MNKTTTTHRLAKLRQLMKNPKYVSKPLNAYIIPSEDAHQSEYTANCDQRRAFISGFTGSMASAIVTDSAAVLWTDGRYYLQAKQEMDDNWTLMKQGLATTPKEGIWLVNHFQGYHKNKTSTSGTAAVTYTTTIAAVSNDTTFSTASPISSTATMNSCVVGADPLLLDCRLWDELDWELRRAGHQLVPIETNLVDLVWGADRPSRPSHCITILEDRWTGRDHCSKIEAVREVLQEQDCCALVLTHLDDVAYLLNLRGSDIPYNPVFFSYVLLTLDTVTLFIDAAKLSPAVLQHLHGGTVKVDVKPYEEMFPYLKEFCSRVPPGRHVWLPSKCSQAVVRVVPEAQRRTRCTPVALAKAVKNDTEAKGMEACHVRDGAAMCSFLAWLEQEAPSRTQTEMSAAHYLEQCRAKQAHYRGLSFETISSVGSNAAIVHYRTSPATNKHITTTEIYLVDSGGHYSDGTTDVTRTVHFGTPSPAEVDAFTRVLKGHIALATAIFPNKLKGNCLDSFARQYLWSVGLDYGHGTSHGVGMYLNVHEGPMGISWRVYPDDPGLQENMFLSNEPGYYKAGEFGIRIESIVRVVKADTPHHHNGLDFLTFKPTTVVPLQTDLMNLTLLTDKEVDYVNAYHSTVLEQVGPLLQEQGDQRGYEWLLRETQPIEKSGGCNTLQR